MRSKKNRPRKDARTEQQSHDLPSSAGLTGRAHLLSLERKQYYIQGLAKSQALIFSKALKHTVPDNAPEEGGRQSMNRKDSCLDNAVMENLFVVLKSESHDLQKSDSPEHFKYELPDHPDYYYSNHRITGK